MKGKKYGGRKRGTPNKATRNAREAIAVFVEGNIERLQRWLDAIETEDGAKAALQSFEAIMEYHQPKLQRTEHVGEGGGPVETVVQLQFVQKKGE